MLTLILGAALFVAFANGANDNFKGVATLYGSGTASYRTALLWATVTTAAGSLCAGFLAFDLLTLFSGKGLVPDETARTAPFVAAATLGAAVTVFLATRLGLPVSTTHALTGGLVGASAIAAPEALHLGHLGTAFLLPLAAAPLVPLVTIGVVVPCVTKAYGMVRQLVTPGAPMPAFTVPRAGIRLWGTETVAEPPPGTRVNSRRLLLDGLHFLSAGAVGFARGLNDAPKILALALAAGVLDIDVGFATIVAVMALGGWLQARRVAETMSKKITHVSRGDGTLANLATAALVIGASRFGLPVTTTHVSVGAIAGIGMYRGYANWRLLGGILGAWVLTLPLATALAALLGALFQSPPGVF
jgi:PiT family inorganic phosphate transporter